METVIHTPSSGGIILNNGSVLLITSALRSTVGFPKGTIDPGETREQAALREVKEETGYNVEIVNFIRDSTFEFDHKNGTHYRKTVSYYLMRLADNDAPEPDLQPGEDFTTAWVPIAEAYQLLTFDDAKQILKQAVQIP